MLGLKFIISFLALGAAASPLSGHDYQTPEFEIEVKQVLMSEPKRTFNLVIEECYWSGEAPLCEGRCPPGTYEKYRDKCGDGKCCFTGDKAFCCKSSSLDGLFQKMLL